MNNPSPHPPYKTPQSPVADNRLEEGKGSLLLGLILPLVILIGGYFAVGILTNLLMIIPGIFVRSGSGIPFIMLGLGSSLLPICGLVGAIIYFIKKGKTRVVAGMAITIGLILLLIAACFGLLIFSPLNLH